MSFFIQPPPQPSSLSNPVTQTNIPTIPIPTSYTQTHVNSPFIKNDFRVDNSSGIASFTSQDSLIETQISSDSVKGVYTRVRASNAEVSLSVNTGVLSRISLTRYASLTPNAVFSLVNGALSFSIQPIASSATATAGAAAIPALASEFLTINFNGADKKIALFDV